ncbi:hypothetical protein DH2020_024079 [Rehmannia glutinosa]|uniref:Tf2-1-like SH3-like domain-containing protein n=1 Tax=Rehmannia glutinosa TaxID=99300 RepID=A0ABR0WAU7_REHGL
MAPYEALYGRKCRSPVHWERESQSMIQKVDLIQEAMDKVRLIKERIRTAQSHQKSYADRRTKDLEFEVGDKVFLRISSRKGLIHPRKGGKLSPRYVGPYQIQERIGKLAYRLELPSVLAGMHDVFHVSRLKKYNPDPEHIIKEEFPEIKEDLSYTERPIRIIDSQIRELRTKKIPLVKVMWQKHNNPEEATWEIEEEMRKSYPELF